MTIGFGARIRELREAHNFTLRQLAERIGSSKAYVWQLENRDHPNPSANIVLDIARVFNVSPYYLINDNMSEDTNRFDEIVLINKINSLGNTDKKIVAEMVDALYKRAG